MTISRPVEPGVSLMLLEGCLTALAIAVAFCWPRLGSGYFSRIEQAFKQLAHRKRLAVAVVGATAFLLRLATLPVNPIPLPFIHDDFSFLLAADTFASGRLTNPTPAMWTHLEAIHVTMKPTYMSMYFPAQGMLLAAGKVLTGHAWFGLLCVTALMCAAICWMLQAWLPPTWALLGGMLAVLRLGMFSYWINTYAGGGSVAALGGALVLGALPRLMKEGRFRHGMLLAVGVALLFISRPYEGLLLCVPVAVVLAHWILFAPGKPPANALLRRSALPVLLIVAAGAWMGYYNYRVFGNPLTPPYKIDRATYAVVPYWVWQPLRPQPVYRHKIMQEFYCQAELANYEAIHSLSRFIPQNLLKVLKTVLFFAGIALIPPLIMLPRVLMDRRIRFLIFCALVFAVGQLAEVFFFPHYLAPLTAAFYAIGLQAMRHLRLWNPGGRPVGVGLVRLTVALCVALIVVRLCADPLRIALSKRPDAGWAFAWYGPGPAGVERANVQARLEQLPGKQLVLVRYSPDHSPMNGWVYNAADIDSSKVIWAREMDSANNLDLIHHYKNRTVWLVQPDTQPAEVSRYPIPGQKLAALN